MHGPAACLDAKSEWLRALFHSQQLPMSPCYNASKRELSASSPYPQLHARHDLQCACSWQYPRQALPRMSKSFSPLFLPRLKMVHHTRLWIVAPLRTYLQLRKGLSLVNFKPRLTGWPGRHQVIQLLFHKAPHCINTIKVGGVVQLHRQRQASRYRNCWRAARLHLANGVPSRRHRLNGNVLGGCRDQQLINNVQRATFVADRLQDHRAQF